MRNVQLAAAVGLVLGGAPVAWAGQAPAAGATVVYPVPAGAPRGEVAVLSLGVAELPVPSLIGTERFVHMRLAAVNREDDQDWVLDARDQRLDLADGRTVEPRYAVVAGGAGPPRMTLRKGERSYLDLFFALDGADPSWSSLTWKVRRRAGAEAIVATTVFELLPGFHPDYAHLRPSQYAGGALWLGPTWCEPSWSGSWLRPYRGYRRYRYGHQPNGFEVSDGSTNWRYERERARPRTPAGETVGSHWRERAPAAPTVVAHPVPLLESAPESGPVSWRLKIEHTVRRDEDSRSATGPSSVGDSWRARHQTEASPRALSDSSSSSSSSSTSSSSDSSPSSSSSDSSSSPSSSSSSSSSSGSSVGSHWRSPR